MTLFFYYDGAGIGDLAVRLGSGFSLSECAEAGVVATSTVQIDDPTGALAIVGLKSFRTVETASSWVRAYTGYIADRTLARADSLLTGAARRWDAAVVDANSALNFRAFQGAASKRPAETDIERLTWALGSAYSGPVSDGGYIDSTGPVDLDETDYRGRFLADVLADCASTSGKNYFVAYDQTANGLVLHYYASSSSLWQSSVRISNVLADVNQTTVFVASEDAKLSRDPSRVYSGVYMAYGDGTASVYVSDSGTASAFASRDLSTTDSTVKTAAGATAKANKLQNQASSEYDRISVTLRKVPAAYVNEIRAGHWIEVKFSHLPGYTSYTGIRVARRTIRQVTTGLYEIDLELANTKAIRGSGGKGPAPDPDGETELVAGSTLTLTRKEASVSTYTGGPAYSYGTVALPRVQSTVSPNTAYTTCGCPLGNGGWGPGSSERAIFWEYTPSLPSDSVGLLLELGVPTELLGVAATGYAFMVVAYGAPAYWGDWTPVGYFQLSVGATLYLPRGLLRDGEVNYFGVAPGWQAQQNAFFCAQDLSDPSGGPVVGGEADSGRSNGFNITAAYATVEGVGIGPWVAGLGLVDGSNRTFSLAGWGGLGSVQLLINGLQQPTDAYVLDRDALTVELEAPPQEGDVVLWRYRLVA